MFLIFYKDEFEGTTIHSLHELEIPLLENEIPLYSRIFKQAPEAYINDAWLLLMQTGSGQDTDYSVLSVNL